MGSRILVIDDDPAMAELVRVALAERGHEILLAGDGEEGLAVIEREKPDLVLLDLLMPRMHGYEVLERLRSVDRTRHLPVIVLSGKAYPTDRRKALDMGADAFVLKPFGDTTEMMERVESMLHRVRVRFWGVRGSIAAPGPETVRYGGNTPCVTIRRGRDLLVLDAGTGLRKLGLVLQQQAGGEPLHVRMLITHTHWDHIQGFPFFVPAFVPGNRVEVWGPRSTDKPLEKVLRGQMDPQYFPVALGDMAASIEVHEIRDQQFEVGPFKVRAVWVNHPGLTMAYRIEVGGRVITYATDTEPYSTFLPAAAPAAQKEKVDGYARDCDAEIVDLARDADLYIADSQYGVAEYARKRGWGHSCYTDAVEMALSAGAQRLALFSHDPMHDDDMIDAKLAHCQKLVEERGASLSVLAASERESVWLP